VRKLGLALLVAASSSCSSARVEAPRAVSRRAPAALLAPLARSTWLPEGTDGLDVVERLPDGTVRGLAGKLRIEASPGGAVRRARDLLPRGDFTGAQALPARMDGGYLFVAAGGGTGAQLFRSKDFLSPLSPLARVALDGGRGATSAPIVVVGPDRLLVRSIASDRVYGVDPSSGAVSAPVPLPPRPRFGAITFADAWRGAAISDLEGLLVTSDAGTTFRRVPLPDAPRSVSIEEGRIVALTASGRWGVDPTSGVAIPDAREGVEVKVEPPPKGKTGARPVFGEHALRAAIEDGWPLPDGTAVVARDGEIARVRLSDGAIVERRAAAMPGEEDARCHAVRYGVDVGFVCGAEGRGTTIYAFAPPLGAQLVARYAAPRAVSPSHSGALSVRGRCDDRPPPPDAGAHCVLFADGSSREIVTSGDVGIERVVPLSNGSVVVVIPPRNVTPGQLAIVAPGASSAITRAMVVPDDAAPIRRGLWLDALYEVSPTELGGWVDAGGAMYGVRIHLEDGTVVVGRRRDEPSVVVVGPHAIAVTHGAPAGDSMQETEDGGMTYVPVDLPPLGHAKIVAGVRCGALGCAVPFERGAWLRVGYGLPADPDDLREVEERGALQSWQPSSRGLSFGCEITRSEPVPVEEEPRVVTTARGVRIKRAPDAPTEATTWPAFRGMTPPALPAGFAGVSEATASGPAARLYAWAPKGSTGRASRVLGRFVDRFDGTSPLRSTAVSVGPWRDDQVMADALGSSGPAVVFHALIDPTGHAALLAGCRGRDRCDLYSMVEGRPMLVLPDSEEEAYQRIGPPVSSAIWLDEAFYLATNTAGSLVVWKIEATRSRVLARLPRVASGASPVPVRLVKRAHGRQIGILASGMGTFGRSEQDFYVLPLDLETGELGETTRLVPTDLGGRAPRHCEADDDGWLVETLSNHFYLRLEPAGRATDVELRLRVEPDRACVDAIAGTLADGLDPKMVKAGGGKRTIPLTLTHRSGRRAVGVCELGPRSSGCSSRCRGRRCCSRMSSALPSSPTISCCSTSSTPAELWGSSGQGGRSSGRSRPSCSSRSGACSETLRSGSISRGSSFSR
jgi:hypothetical protein